MAGESKASASPFKGRNRGSPLENPHRAKKVFKNCKFAISNVLLLADYLSRNRRKLSFRMPDHMTGESKASAPVVQGENRGSPLEKILIALRNT
jgi:hypothetical protein